MNPTCDRCARWIEHDNRSHPGYCSPGCHDAARAQRDAMLAAQAARRRDEREQQLSHLGHLT